MDSRLGLPVNTVLDGDYRIMRVVGAGGFGITYEAEDINLGTLVAVKEYYPLEFGDRDRTMSVRPKSDGHRQTFDWGRINFLEEARTLARFEHPSIVRVTRVFEANATAYMVMRFEVGLSFESWLSTIGRPPTQEELDGVTAPLLDALQLMHAANFLHRDIAPDNIIIRPDGTPVLLDFGAARRAAAEMSRSLTGVVKAGYSPHEQYSSDGRLQGPWSDIYALGATLYRAVIGQSPEESTLRFDEDLMSPVSQAAKGKYRPAFLAAIDACLNVRHSERPQSVAELRQRLFKVTSRPDWAERLITGARTAVPATSSSVRRMSRGWPAIAAVVAVLVGAYIGLAYRPLGASAARQDAAHAAVQIDPDEARRRKALADAAEAERRRRDEAMAEERHREERRIAALEDARRNEAKRIEGERLRLAAIPSDAQRTLFVKRMQEVLKRNRCYEGQLTGRIDDTQEGLNRFVEAAGGKSSSKPARIELAKASVGDFEAWFRDADTVSDARCLPKISARPENSKPPVQERTARAPLPRQEREVSRPHYARSYEGGGGGGGGGEMGVVLGIGH